MKKDTESEALLPPIPPELSGKPAWFRVHQQLLWYNSRSKRAQAWYKTLKVLQIGLAIFIPMISFLQTPFSSWAAAISGALIAFLESIQHLNQYSALWITYRSTAEGLKHEMFLFLSTAGPYRDGKEDERLQLLSERVEEILSRETGSWVQNRQKEQKSVSGSGH